MQKETLLEILKQNQFTSHFSLDRVSDENVSLRLNDKHSIYWVHIPAYWRNHEPVWCAFGSTN